MCLKGVSCARSYVLIDYVLFCFVFLNGEALSVTSHTTVDVTLFTEVSGEVCSYESTSHNSEEV